ncbi:helix-turn-helix domain-containing protein [Ochrobactrum chromiisoli]|uniref:Helix-turn-helix transcriptional regulator n=1 Tax=Ochrobactrum chromiisoli TaxID=2993941 RepID=A0ABT3QSI4_9HYPH|nr:helix-turn-helix transcriptional regulator [Ochrobactrum chromiisoli]MCX2698522.1 helix-turn-helix transcriptional regulator [Ochrobactrum chromiisoli]
MITAEQCRAGRALVDWSQIELSDRSRIAKKTIADFERGNRAYHPKTSHAVKVALESHGVIFIPENGGGVGVRLRKAMPRLFRRDPVNGREWMAFAFDYKGQRHTGFVTYRSLVRIALDSLSPTEIFDRDKARILLIASDKIDAGQVDEHGRVLVDWGDLSPVEFDSDEERARNSDGD